MYVSQCTSLSILQATGLTSRIHNAALQTDRWHTSERVCTRQHFRATRARTFERRIGVRARASAIGEDGIAFLLRHGVELLLLLAIGVPEVDDRDGAGDELEDVQTEVDRGASAVARRFGRGCECEYL